MDSPGSRGNSASKDPEMGPALTRSKSCGDVCVAGDEGGCRVAGASWSAQGLADHLLFKLGVFLK